MSLNHYFFAIMNKYYKIFEIYLIEYNLPTFHEKGKQKRIVDRLSQNLDITF